MNDEKAGVERPLLRSLGAYSIYLELALLSQFVDEPRLESGLTLSSGDGLDTRPSFLGHIYHLTTTYD